MNYIKLNIKERTNDWGSILACSAKLDELIKSLSELEADEKGYVRFDICPRKEKGQYGDTHYAKENTWKPNKQDTNDTPMNEPKPVSEPTGDLPF